MKVLILGGSGATGRRVIEQLLQTGSKVVTIVRNKESLPSHLLESNGLDVLEASVLDLSEQDFRQCIEGCDAVVSCLGHTLSFKGIYGQPRRLVTDAIKRCCKAIEALQPEKPIKLVLMNTTGNRNKDLHEPVSFAHKAVILLLRLLLPPHVDNEAAAEYLRVKIGQNHPLIEWSAVRPDGLVDENKVTDYELHVSPTRDAIFDAGQTSRINVANFMKELITSEESWQKWKGKMPVIYNQPSN